MNIFVAFVFPRSPSACGWKRCTSRLKRKASSSKRRWRAESAEAKPCWRARQTIQARSNKKERAGFSRVSS